MMFKMTLFMVFLMLVIVKNLALIPEIDNNSTGLTDRNNFFFQSNTAGMFSQFIQAKMMHYIAEKLNRNLKLAPFYSNHYNNAPTSICDFVIFPSTVSCDTVPAAIKCHKTFPANIKNSTTKNFCFKGSMKFNDVNKPRQYIVESIDSITVPFKLNPKNMKHYDDFKQALGVSAKDTKFTVVHWRRGDQVIRCKRNVDNSVNCDDAANLVATIRKYTSDDIIFVATNEPQDSDELAELNKNGIHTFYSVAAKMTKANHNHHASNKHGSSNSSSNGSVLATVHSVARKLAKSINIDRFLKHKASKSGGDKSSTVVTVGDRKFSLYEILAMESQLMLDASTFLAWGVSEINDVVEYERKLANKTYCIDQAVVNDLDQLTWCALQNRTSLIPDSVKFEKSFLSVAQKIID